MMVLFHTNAQPRFMIRTHLMSDGIDAPMVVEVLEGTHLLLDCGAGGMTRPVDLIIMEEEEDHQVGGAWRQSPSSPWKNDTSPSMIPTLHCFC